MRAISRFLISSALVYLLGFLIFLGAGLGMGRAPLVEKRAFVAVLTGAPGRLDFGTQLLRDGLADAMLVTGVDPSVSVATLARSGSLPPAIADCCVVLGYEAQSTLGNICETRAFSEARNLNGDVYIATSYYHVPRVALLRWRFWADASPQIVAATGPSWNLVPHPQALRTLLQEYNKLLITFPLLLVSPRAACDTRVSP